MGATLINLCQNSSTASIHCHSLMNVDQKRAASFLCLAVMPNEPPVRRGGGRNLFHHLSKIGLLRITYLNVAYEDVKNHLFSKSFLAWPNMLGRE